MIYASGNLRGFIVSSTAVIKEPGKNFVLRFSRNPCGKWQLPHRYTANNAKCPAGLELKSFQVIRMLAVEPGFLVAESRCDASGGRPHVQLYMACLLCFGRLYGSRDFEYCSLRRLWFQCGYDLMTRNELRSYEVPFALRDSVPTGTSGKLESSSNDMTASNCIVRYVQQAWHSFYDGVRYADCIAACTVT
jgi:hypothetical protein